MDAHLHPHGIKRHKWQTERECAIMELWQIKLISSAYMGPENVDENDWSSCVYPGSRIERDLGNGWVWARGPHMINWEEFRVRSKVLK